MRRSPAPSARDASTKSCSFAPSTAPRTTPGEVRDPGDPDRDDDVHEPDAEHRNDEDRRHDGREAEHHVDDTRAESVHPPAGEADEDAEEASEDRREEHGRDADGKRESSAVEDPGEDVAAVQIRAEEVQRGRGAQARPGVRRVVVERSQHRREDRARDEGGEDDRADESARVDDERAEHPAGGEAPARGLGDHRGGHEACSSLMRGSITP